MAFAKDKAKLEGVLLGNLLVNGDPQMDGDYISLGQLYARMHADSRVHFDMPRLMKVLSLDIYKGFVEWGFNGRSSEVMLHLTQKGRVEAAIRIKENRAWLPEDYEKPDDVEDIADQYCVGMILPPVEDSLYSKKKVLSDYLKKVEDHLKNVEDHDEDAEDSDEIAKALGDLEDYDWGRLEPDGVRILPYDDYDESDDDDEWAYDDELEDDGEPEDDGELEDDGEPKDDGKPTEDSKPVEDSKPTSGDNAASEGTTAPRTVVFCGDVAFWADTHEELTSEEYKDILGITEKDLADLSKGCDGECFDFMEDRQEDVDEPASAQYCYFCGAASDLQANFCNHCGRRLVSGSGNPGITGAHLHLVYEDEEPGELPVRGRQTANNLRQQDMLSDMDALYCMLLGLGMLD